MIRWRRLLGPACASLLVHAVALTALALVTVRLTLGGEEPRETVTVTLAPQTATPHVRAPDARSTRQRTPSADPVARAAPVEAVASSTDVDRTARGRLNSDDFTRTVQGSGRDGALDPGIALGGQRVEFAGASARGASRIVFVIDRSGPMVTVRTPVHSEVRRAVESLAARTEFEVIAAGGDAPRSCFGELRPADRTALRSLDNWLDSLLSGGSPDPASGLARALSLEPDVVFLLSSGTEPSAAAARRAATAIERIDALNPPGRDGVRRTLILPIRFGDAGDGSLLDTIARRFGPPGAPGALVRALDELPTEPSINLTETEGRVAEATALASRAASQGAGMLASLGMTAPNERERIAASAHEILETLRPEAGETSLDPDAHLLRARALLTLAACRPAADERRSELLVRASAQLEAARERVAGRATARLERAQLDVLRATLGADQTRDAKETLREFTGDHVSTQTALVLLASADSPEQVTRVLEVIPPAQRPLAVSIGVRRALRLGPPDAAWALLRGSTTGHGFDVVRSVLSARLARRTTAGATPDDLMFAARAGVATPESVAWLDKAARIAEDGATRAEALVRAADLLGDTPDALERLVGASALGSRDATRRAVRLGMALDQHGEPSDELYDTALRSHASLVPEANDHAYWLGVLGERLLARGFTAEALGPLGEAARRGDAPASSALLDAAWTVRTKEAIRALRNASLDEDADRLALDCAETAIERGDAAEALAMVNLIDTPTDDAVLARVETMGLAGQTEQAMQTLRPVLDRVEASGVADERFWRAWTLALELFSEADDGSLTADRTLHLRRLQTIDEDLGGPPWRDRLEASAP
ncbi:MAG: hypothetical protein AAGG07_07615 [Planctomycetota bacterium]